MNSGFTRHLKTIFALIAVALALSLTWRMNQPAVIPEATMADVIAEAKQGEYQLINVDELADLHKNRLDQIMVVDTRQEWEYLSGHIENAVNFPMEPTWLDRLRKKDDLETFLGPDQDKTIVFY